MTVFFIMGNHPRLSQAEIISFLKTNDLTTAGNCILCDLANQIDLPKLQDTLGGAVKIGIIIGETACDTVIDDIFEYAKKNAPQIGKLYFGISCYNTSYDSKKDGLRLKQKLAKHNIASRWVQSRQQPLSSVVVKTNKLLSARGIEFVIIHSGAKLLLGVTKTVQPFDEFSARDYGRPCRDTASGMIPPKLAKIMINLARITKNDALLDPFCGSGTILQEALLMGYTRVIGADISQKAIENTKANMRWLSHYYKKLPSQTLYQTSVNSLHKSISPHSIKGIVTEPYLGPPLRGDESTRKLNDIVKKLVALYASSFAAFKKLLAPDGKVVIIAPIIKNTRLPIFPEIRSAGFNHDTLFAHLYDDSGRQSFVYGRVGQKVWREIFVFTLKP